MPIVPQGPLEGAEYHRWTISRKDDDYLDPPLAPEHMQALRASIGGNEKIGFYLVFRGEPEEIAKMLEMASQVANAVRDGRQSVNDKRTRRPKRRPKEGT